MTKFEVTPSQTVGPYLRVGLPWDRGENLVPDREKNRVMVEGLVLDGEGVPVPDALIEIWQANPDGAFAHPEDQSGQESTEGFTGFGRSPTDENGRFFFVTVKPGRVPGRGNTLQAPHLSVIVLARGMLKQQVTRIYFPDEMDANDEDPVLNLIEDKDRRQTLIANEPKSGEDGMPVYHFDIRLQGENETVFFDV